MKKFLLAAALTALAAPAYAATNYNVSLEGFIEPVCGITSDGSSYAHTTRTVSFDNLGAVASGSWINKSVDTAGGNLEFTVRCNDPKGAKLTLTSANAGLLVHTQRPAGVVGASMWAHPYELRLRAPAIAGADTGYIQPAATQDLPVAADSSPQSLLLAQGVRGTLAFRTRGALSGGGTTLYAGTYKDSVRLRLEGL